jgi:hypothetical protein
MIVNNCVPIANVITLAVLYMKLTVPDQVNKSCDPSIAGKEAGTVNAGGGHNGSTDGFDHHGRFANIDAF